jgi:putative adhesin
MRLKMIVVATLAAPLAGLLTVQADSSVWRQGLLSRTAADFRWTGHVPAGSTFEVKGVNGDVTAEASSGSQVEVTAIRKGRRSDPEDVRIEVVEHGGGITVCAVYPSRRSDRPNECKPGREGRMNTDNNDVHVKFTIRVPAGVRFVGRTVNGDVEAVSLSGPVDVGTVNGSVTFSTSSYGEASTVNGSIKGAMGSTDWTHALEFSTVNGSITVDLPANLSTDLRARSVNGDISTDFPLTVTGRVSPQRLDGTIGAGGRSLDMTTVNGSVRLRKR